MRKTGRKMKMAVLLLATAIAVPGVFRTNTQAAVLRSYIQWVGTSESQVVSLAGGNVATLRLQTPFAVADGTDVAVSDGPFAWYQHNYSEYDTTGVTVSVSGQNNDVLRVDATYDLTSQNGIWLCWYGVNTCNIYGETSCGFYRNN